MGAPAEAIAPSAETRPLLFLSHAGADTDATRKLAERIENAATARRYGLRVWVDKRKEPGLGLAAGVGWQRQLEEAIGARSTAFAVYLGASGIVNWVEAEVRLALSRATSRPPYPFIPVIAAGARSQDLPGFAQQYQGVRDVERDGDALEQLLRAVLRLDDAERVRLEDEPFLGLRAFDESRSHLFFGRERETARVLWRLRRRCLVMVTGDSGSGKSSLVKAGVVPKWRGGVLARRDERPNETIWHVVETRPGASPFRELGNAVFALGEAFGRSAEDRGTYKKWAMQDDAEQRRDGLRCGLPADRTRTLLVVDQFEELFTQTPQGLQQPFIDVLLDLVDPREDARFHVVLTMRRDYYNLIHPYGALRERLEQPWSRYTLGRMSDTGLRRVVTEPLKLGGVDDVGEREALAKAVLRDVGQQPGDLALVQFALTEAWDRHRSQKGGMLKAYVDVGGVEGALARAADRLFTAPAGDGRDGLTSEEKALAEPLFIRLVRLGDTAGATRRLATRDEFSQEAWALAQKLATKEFHRLLVTGGQGVETAELSHEALVTQWPQYQSWLQASAGVKRIHDWVTRTAKEWVASNGSRRKELLLKGDHLDQGAKLLKDRPEWLSNTERQFLKRSRAAARRQSALKWFAVGLLLLLTVTSLAVGRYAYDRSVIAEAERDRALINQSRFLAQLSGEQLETNPTLAVLLTLEALPRDIGASDRPFLPDAEAALYRAVAAHHERLVLRGHEAWVNTAAVAPDGRTVVTASYDRTARLWDAASGAELRVLRGHDDIVFTAAFRPDGRTVVTAGNDGTARLWDAASGAERLVLRRHEGPVTAAAFAPDGRTVVTASGDRTARLWDAASGAERLVLRGHQGTVWSAAFAPDGRTVITASEDSTARLWDAVSGMERLVLRGHQGTVWSAAFAPDGRTVVTAGSDGTARLWDAASGVESLVLRGHTKEVNGAGFTSDGRTVITASGDGTARLWDAVSGAERLVLRGHEDEDAIFAAAFAPDGRTVVTASGDRTARLWDAASGAERFVLRGHEDRVTAAAFAPDGRTVVTAGDATARLWDAETGAERLILRGHEDIVDAAAFAPDGRTVVTNSSDGTARLWDAASGAERLVLRGHEGAVWSAAFAPDGRSVVTASHDGTARLWDAVSGAERLVLRGHEGPVFAAAFAPDGRSVVTASDDGTARLWRWRTGQALIDHAYEVLPMVVTAGGAAQRRRLTPDERRRFFLDPEPAGDGASDATAASEPEAE